MAPYVNGGQWIVILVVSNVLANIGLSDWVIPAAVLVVGLHFFPLASLLDNPAQYATGAAFLVWAIVYPFVAPDGAKSALGPLGAGLILWMSVLWNIALAPTLGGR